MNTLRTPPPLPARRDLPAPGPAHPPNLWPADLRAVFGEEALVRRVLAAAASLNDLPDRLPPRFPNPEGLQPLALLSFVTYAYAVGCRDSEEIEETARTDRTLGYLSAGQLPSSPTIRRFRRHCRRAVAAALALVLDAAAGRAGQPATTEACLAEARRRLDEAVLADTMALDR